MTPQEILDIRKKLKMSQTRFAELLGVSFATVNRWENGRNIPSALAIEKIKTMVTGPSAPKTLNPYGTFQKSSIASEPPDNIWTSYNKNISLKKMMSDSDLDYDKEMDKLKYEIEWNKIDKETNNETNDKP
jgi:transcriptional regulator with XRE-family HTH domain